MSAALNHQGVIDRESLSNESLVAFIGDAETRAVVAQAVNEKWPAAVIQDGDVTAALDLLAHEASPSIVIVDFGATEDPVTAARSIRSTCDADTRIIGIGDLNDVTTYHLMRDAGVSDYLVRPLDPDLLLRAMKDRKQVVTVQAGDAAKTTRVIHVIGARSGVGASTIALNLAWIMAHRLERMVGLIDLDLQFGTIALQLDIEPSIGLREALDNADRVDGLYLASAMAQLSERMFVLSAEEPLEEDCRINPTAFAHLLENLPKDLDTVVVDLPVRLAAGRRELLSKASAVAVVSDLTLAGMRDTLRVVQLLRETAPQTTIAAILNKTRPGKTSDISRTEFEQAIGIPIRHAIPLDDKAVGAAAGQGRPLAAINEKHEIITGLTRVAEVFVGRRPTKSSPTQGLRRLLRLS